MENYYNNLSKRHAESNISSINRASFLLSKKSDKIVHPRRKESMLAEEALKIFFKRANKRTDQEIEKIMEFTKEIKFFKEYLEKGEIEIQRKCCEKMFLQKNNAGDIVFEQGSVGDKFYIVLEGKVAVCIDDKTGEKKGDRLFKVVKTLDRGDSFGELALLNNKPRGATIICEEECHFAILNQKDFEMLLKSKEELKLIQESELFTNIALFSDWPFSMIKYMYQSSYSLTFRLNSTVFTEGEACEGFYVVESGSFLIYKTLTIDLPETQNNHISKTASSKIIKISILERGSYFGEEDILNVTKRNYSVMALKSSSVVRIIPLNFFKRYIAKNDVCNKALVDGAKNKQKMYNTMISKVIKQIKIQNSQKPKLSNKLPYFFKTPQTSTKTLNKFVQLKSSAKNQILEEETERIYRRQSIQNERDCQMLFSKFQKQEEYSKIYKNPNNFRVKNYVKSIPKFSGTQITTTKSSYLPTSPQIKISDFYDKLTSNMISQRQNTTQPLLSIRKNIDYDNEEFKSFEMNRKMKSFDDINYYIGLHISTPTKFNHNESQNRKFIKGTHRARGPTFSFHASNHEITNNSNLSNFLKTTQLRIRIKSE